MQPGVILVLATDPRDDVDDAPRVLRRRDRPAQAERGGVPVEQVRRGLAGEDGGGDLEDEVVDEALAQAGAQPAQEPRAQETWPALLKEQADTMAGADTPLSWPMNQQRKKGRGESWRKR